jgi:hypothetical protein
MAYKIKALGLTLIAAFALSAAAASSAVAAEGLVTPGKFPASITGSQVGRAHFSLGFGGTRQTECAVTRMTSTSVLGSAASSVSYKPVCSGAISSPGGSASTVSAGACTWSLTTTTKLTATSGEASLTITGCGFGSNPSMGAMYFVVNTFGPCEYEVGNQGPLSTIKWSSQSSEVLLSWALKFTAIVVKGALGSCGASTGNSVTLAYSGEETFTADSGGAATSLLVS